MRGVASVVTGGGKTIFAFLCVREFWKEHRAGRIIVLVPTITLLDQWYVSLQEDFGMAAEEIACFSSQEKSKKPGVVNILVINSWSSSREQTGKGSKKFSSSLTNAIMRAVHRMRKPCREHSLQRSGCRQPRNGNTTRASRSMSCRPWAPWSLNMTTRRRVPMALLLLSTC